MTIGELFNAIHRDSNPQEKARQVGAAVACTFPRCAAAAIRHLSLLVSATSLPMLCQMRDDRGSLFLFVALWIVAGRLAGSER